MLRWLSYGCVPWGAALCSDTVRISRQPGLGSGVRLRPNVYVVAEARVAFVQDPCHHGREGSKGCIEFVASMVITLPKVKHDHYKLAEPLGLCFLCPQRLLV